MSNQNGESAHPKFELGQVVATPDAINAMERSGQSPAEFLSRHQRCDWGEVCQEDGTLNDEALKDGSRLFSVYCTSQNECLWVITEADRSSTCILLPENY
jgi:hypothetical protein